MHNIFFTSDNHFSHKRIKEFCPNTRNGDDVLEMDRLMIKAWNAKVPPSGTVYMLGDFSFATAERTERILSQLNGEKHFIFGNHDKVVRKNPHIIAKFASTQEYKEISYEKTRIVMSHYPMREWNHMHRGSFHLFGHVHGNLDKHVWGRSMDVGIDSRPNGDMAPWGWEEINKILTNREILPHHNGFRKT